MKSKVGTLTTPPTIVPRQKELEKLHKKIFFSSNAQTRRAKKTTQRASPQHIRLTDEEVIEKARAAQNGDTFDKLFGGDWSDYPSQSEGDYELCKLFAFWTSKDPTQMDALFRKSGLYRDKWDERHASDGRTYGQITMENAIEATTNVYQQNLRGRHNSDITNEKTLGNPYRVTPNGLLYLKPTRNGTVLVPLSNFSAQIEADVSEDDGVESRRFFEIVARLNQRQARFKVPATQFSGMTWVTEHLGAQAVLYPGPSIKDHARAAIQMTSSDIAERRIFTHTGWRCLDGVWMFLHADGAVGSLGPQMGIEQRDIYFTDEELRKIRELSTPAFWREVKFAVETCLRASEQYGLRWNQVNFDTKLLTIPLPKGNKTRRVPLSEEALRILRSLDSGLESPWVFPSHLDNLQLKNPRAASNHFARILRKGGIKGTWHTLRHTGATRRLLAGVDLVTVSRILGHRKIQTTMRYLHLVKDHMQDAINRGSLKELENLVNFEGGSVTKCVTNEVIPS